MSQRARAAAAVRDRKEQRNAALHQRTGLGHSVTVSRSNNRNLKSSARIVGASGAIARAGVADRRPGPPGRSRGKRREEKRVDPDDGGAYTKDEFVSLYGGAAEWDAAVPESSQHTLPGYAGRSHAPQSSGQQAWAPEPSPRARLRPTVSKSMMVLQKASEKVRASNRMAKHFHFENLTTKPSPKKEQAGNTVFAAMQQKMDMVACGCCRLVWRFSFDPNGGFRRCWDAFILILVLYSAASDPYKAAFILPITLPGESTMTVADYVVDACFYLDIILTFWTGVDTGYQIIMDKSIIAKRYLRRWFWIDLAATLQWDLIVNAVDAGFSTDHMALARMFKVVRVARVGRLLDKVTQHWTSNTAYVDFCKFCLIVITVAHVMACLFYMVPTLFICQESHHNRHQISGGPQAIPAEYVWWNKWYLLNSSKYDMWNSGQMINGADDWVRYSDSSCLPLSWRTYYGLEARDENGFRLMSPERQYIDAMYWSLTTMTTIGYGDRVPRTLAVEICFTLFAEVLGLMFFALLLKQIPKLNDVMTQDIRQKNATKNEIMDVMNSNDIDETLKRKVVRFLNFQTSALSGHTLPKDGVFSRLSESLQRDIRVNIYKPVLARLRMFGRSEEDYRDQIYVTRVFEQLDVDNSKSLNGEEIRLLLGKLKLPGVSADQFMNEMIGLQQGEGVVASHNHVVSSKEPGDYAVHVEDFQHWWYVNKYGRSSAPVVPDAIGRVNNVLDMLATNLHTFSSSPNDIAVGFGDYCSRICILNSGCMVARRVSQTERLAQQIRIGSGDHDGKSQATGSHSVPATSVGTVVRGFGDTDGFLRDQAPDPIFGFQALFEGDQYLSAVAETRDVVVYSHEHHCECLYIERDDALHCFAHWSKGLKFWRALGEQRHREMLELDSSRPVTPCDADTDPHMPRQSENHQVRKSSEGGNLRKEVAILNAKVDAVSSDVAKILKALNSFAPTNHNSNTGYN